MMEMGIDWILFSVDYRQSACGEMDRNSAIICRGRGELLSGKAKPLLKL